jgi:hypothetical protein
VSEPDPASHRNADAERWLPEPDPVSHSDANRNADGDTASDTKSNCHAFAYSGAGVEYLDTAAG